MSTRIGGQAKKPRRRRIVPAATAPSALSTLHDVLGPMLDVAPAGDLPGLLQAQVASWLAPTDALRFDGHLDLRVDLLVYLPPEKGGVLGLVHALPHAAADFVTQARTAMEGAVRLRQLLLEKAEAARPPQRALQVELLLLVPPDVPEEQRGQLALEFNHVARHTQYLRLVGLNLLPMPASGGSFEAAALRRAFCWLLRDTRIWFAEIHDAGQAPAPSWELTLNDYRLAGVRRFGFDGGAGRLHLVQGHNGAGKSTLVEALELLLTHKVQRLDRGGQTPYHPAIRHRPRGHVDPKQGPAIAELNSGGATLAHCVVDSSGQRFGSAATAPMQRVQSFRIDQVFMNDLVSADRPAALNCFWRLSRQGKQRCWQRFAALKKLSSKRGPSCPKRCCPPRRPSTSQRDCAGPKPAWRHWWVPGRPQSHCRGRPCCR
jgi:hypothetical protein